MTSLRLAQYLGYGYTFVTIPGEPGIHSGLTWRVHYALWWHVSSVIPTEHRTAYASCNNSTCSGFFRFRPFIMRIRFRAPVFGLVEKKTLSCKIETGLCGDHAQVIYQLCKLCGTSHIRIIWFLWTKPTIWLLFILSFTHKIVRACSMFCPFEGYLYRSVTLLDAARVNRTTFHNHSVHWNYITLTFYITRTFQWSCKALVLIDTYL